MSSKKTHTKSPFKYKDGYMFVDVSYLVFYRFYALKKWFSFAHKDIKITDDIKWLDNTLFMDKFEKTLLVTTLLIAKKQKIDPKNIIFAFDCRHKDIWRIKIKPPKSYMVDESNENNEFNDYKGTRALSHEKQNFTEFKLFDIVKDTLLPPFIQENNNLILEHKNAEADDCIALGIRYIRDKQQKSTVPIWIVASDTDYLQICDEHTHLIDLKKADIAKKHLVDKKITKKEYLIHKLLVGDVSDNIRACELIPSSIEQLETDYSIKIRKNKTNTYKITKSIATKLMETHDTFKLIDAFLNEPDIKKKPVSSLPFLKTNYLIFNQHMIDFRYIPKTIESSIYEMCSVI